MNAQPTFFGTDLFDVSNEDLVRAHFGHSREVIRYRHRDREDRGRVRARPGYTATLGGARDLTTADLAAHWRGE